MLATLAAAGSRRGIEVFLCSSDKDCRQLIDDRVRMYSLRKRQVFGRDELLADWGIKPEQVVDLQTLVGDSVDNVPGVPGIGIKTAAKLLQDFGTLENILANIDRVPGAKRQESLRNSGDHRVQPPARALSTDVPLDTRLGRLAFARDGWTASARSCSRNGAFTVSPTSSANRAATVRPYKANCSPATSCSRSGPMLLLM